MITAAGVERETVRQAPVEETVAGLTAFGHQLYGKAAEPGTNIVLSPLSIAYAYGMARAGAAPATAAELDRLFGFPAQGPHTAFNLLTRQIVTTDGPPPEPKAEPTPRPDPPVVAIANGLFTQRGFAPKQPFLHTLASQYGTGVHTVDFPSGGAVDSINAWADERTAGRIKKVFERLGPDTKAVLANAVYLKADWRVPFAEEPPEQNATFTKADGSTVSTTLMRNESPFRYAEGPGWQAVELPYAESELAMWVLVPPKGTSPAGLLAPETLRKVGDGLRETMVGLSLPKWDFATMIDLGREVELAVNDFSGIADGIFLREAVHRATITVDEWGTEAAAVTGLAFPQSASPRPEAEVRADHPFGFVIMHVPTRTPLFLGHVASP